MSLKQITKLLNIITKMSEIKKFVTEKGKPMLYYQGYFYTLDRQTEIKLIFRCKNRD